MTAELTAGQTFGGYRIMTLLGRGGMGAVYAAEQLEDGRVVAVKVLAAGLERAEDRERFLREGRTAASVNHPNTVYVYRTEEIDGRPTIAMELVEGGTLEEKIEKQGPLSVAQAIDDTLQVIDGLEAAHRLGILHRDIKPANCFVGADGAVKVGDFGLSRPVESVEQGRLTQTGLFLGTPVFSSPEQLMGEKLDVRADIYAVGATLYFLLTGKLPFDADNAVKLIAVVMSGTPTPITQYRPDVPPALAAVITKCLARPREERFADYAALRAALLACRPVELQPAPLVRRVGAGVIDSYVISTLSIPLLGLLRPMGVQLATTASDPRYAAYQTAAALPIELLIYGVLEGLTGWTPAKRLLGIRTARADGTPPGIPRALLRGFCVVLPGLVAAMASLQFTDAARQASVTMLIGFGGLGLLFIRARQRNGWLAEHDRLTGTRVVAARAVAARTRDVAAESRMLPVVATASDRVGAYDIVGALDTSGDVLLATDGALQRPVWVVRRALGAPPLPEAERQASRTTCARWIGGRRSASEAWDAYAALGGTPLRTRLAEGAAWSTVQAWLADLVAELRARRDAPGGPSQGASDVALTAAHVLITDDGHAVLLPFATDRSSATRTTEPLLAQVAAELKAGLPEATRAEWPLRAHAVLGRLADPRATLEELAQAIASAGEARPPLTRRRRATLGAATFVPIAFMAVVSAYARNAVLPRDPEVDRLQPLLAWLAKNRRAEEKQGERALVIAYVAGPLRGAVERHRAGKDSLVVKNSNVSRSEWAIADTIVRNHPRVSADELTRARALVEGQWGGRPPGVVPLRELVTYLTFVAFYVTAGICALLAAVFARRGVMLRLLGVEVVSSPGVPAGRLRLAWRQIVSWVPAGVAFAAVAATTIRNVGGGTALPIALGAGAFALVLAGTALYSPARGLAERLSGTRLVPE